MALQINKNNPFIWSNKGKLFKFLKKYQDAMNWYIKIL